MAAGRSFLSRALMLVALLAPPVMHTGCLQKAAYELRLQQKVRDHVYPESASKLLKTAKTVAEKQGWTIDEDDSDDRSFVTKPRTLNGAKQHLKVRAVSDSDGARIEADVFKMQKFGNDEKEQKFMAAELQLAVLEKLDPDAADKLRSAAKKQSKEDAKAIRACARKAIDEDEKSEKSSEKDES